MEKKTVSVTCPELLPEKTLDWLRGTYQLNTASCALSKEELIKNLSGVDIYILGGEERVDLEVIKSTNLQAVVFVGIGWESFFDEPARQYLKARDMIFATGGGGAAVARSTLDEIESWWLLQSIFSHRKEWNPASAEKLLKNLSVSVIGVGNIGAKVASSLAGRCNLSYFESQGERQELKSLGIPREENLQEAFEADIISVHLAFIPKVTEFSIRLKQLERVKEYGIVINNARFQIFDPEDTLILLKERRDVSVICDVLDPFEGNNFLRLRSPKSDMEKTYRQIVDCPNFFFTQHTCITKHIELSVPEYGQGLEKILKTNNLI